MRFDRLATVGMAAPLERVLRPFVAQARTRTLPILMYHSISDDPESATHPYFRVCASPARFAEHMGWLSEMGFTGVTLSEALAWLLAGAPSTGAPLPVALTFDDGFRDFHSAAFPVLRRHGFSASMYLSTGFVSEPRKAFKSRDCLTWGEVRELHAEGVEFGSHTVSHPRLVELPWASIERELIDSRTAIEQALGAPVRSFAYPYAFPQAETAFAARLCGMLSEAGYRSCVTTRIGIARSGGDLMRLPRLPANSDDDRQLFAAKLSGAYNWLAAPQALAKTLSSYLRPSRRPLTVRT